MSDQLTNQISAIQKGTQDYISRCEMEARQLQEKFEAESHNVDLVEKEAHEFLEVRFCFLYLHGNQLGTFLIFDIKSNQINYYIYTK